ncbi:12269_t:CDS:2, partial [Ambispora gerdemannii]
DDVFSPIIRYGHTANYYENDKKIYFLGGVDRNNNTLADFFTLEISNITAPKFEILYPSTSPKIAFATSVIISSKIYVYGSSDGKMLNQGFLIDISISSKPTWNSLNIPAYLPPAQALSIYTNKIIGSSGDIYIFTIQSDRPKMLRYDTNTAMVEDLEINTTVDLKGNDRSKVPSSHSTATYFGNSIIYIGGKSLSKTLIPMNQILIYNISDHKLILKSVTSTDDVVGRYGHSACLVQNKIIVYGGLSENEQSLDSNNALVILEINNDSYSWRTEKIPNNQIIPYYHTATINDIYMIIAFGKDSKGDKLIGDDSLDSKLSNAQHTKRGTSTGGSASDTNFISILNVNNYEWVTSPNEETVSTKPDSNTPGSTQSSGSNSTTTSMPSPKKGSNIGSIVGGIIGGILGAALLASLVFFFYRRNNTRKRGNSESFHELTASTRQISTQQSSIPPAPTSRSLPSIPWVSPLKPNPSIQPLQAEQSAPVMLTLPLTNLNISELSSVESRQPLDSSSSAPSLLSIPLVSSNPSSPFYKYDD